MNNNINRQQVRPNNHRKTRRPHDVIKGTTMPPGRVVPLALIPLLREDSAAGVLDITVEMMETHEILLNGVQLRVMAYCVPWLAMERFKGSREEFDLSFAGKEGLGGEVIPFFELQAAGVHGANAIFKYLGIHAEPTDQINTMPIEGYNLIDDFRRKNRNDKLSKRTRLDTSLAQGYWDHSRFAALVADWDDAMTDMEVPLTVRESQMPVRAPNAGAGSGVADVYYRDTDNQLFLGAAANAGREIMAEMVTDGITVSLANIERAKKTKAYALLRQKFSKLEDDHIIDMLMDGLTVPEQHLKQPFLIGQGTGEFQQIKRYSTEADYMDRSAVSGGVKIKLPIRCPSIATGGMIFVVAEAMPNQLFERQADPFVHITNERYDSSGDLKDIPSYIRDDMDEQKVDLIFNKQIDVNHNAPTVLFAHAPMNWEWAAFGPTMGGDYFRPEVNTTTDTTRLNLWAVETPNPTFGEAFQRAGTVHKKVFIDDTQDPFRATVKGRILLTGLTIFGDPLIENGDDWEEVEDMGPQPVDQIEKPQE